MLKLYNTLSRKKEVFKPRKNKRINLFVCGPTVYDYSHLGHARTYLIFDAFVKYLRQAGYKVFYLQNITDIDDKIIKRAQERKTTPLKLARLFEKEYLKDAKNLKINSVTKYARGTEHIQEIISQVERLRKKGFAYQIEDGIYYDISKFKNYGKLAGRTVLQAEDGTSRIDESVKKKNRGDFCLWKFSKPDEPKWPSPFGQGRPGWHVEDTAISEKYFGSQYDIHGGARDLIFPHHEAEIAQMEAISGKSPFVKYWLHSGFLTVENKKMAKSLGNFITIKDFLEKNSARILRLLVIKNHYRSPFDYKESLVLQTKKELAKIDEFVKKAQSLKSKTQSAKFKIIKYEEDFQRAMEDDFNTPKAMAIIFQLINKGNALADKEKLGKNEAKKILEFLKRVDQIFTFIFEKEEKAIIPKEIIKLANEREKYRKEKKWQKADQIRNEIKEIGYQIEDTKKGLKIKKLY